MQDTNCRSPLVEGKGVTLCSPLDNHDVISLKLFELTGVRTPEEEKLHRDVFLPSVDNLKLPESECGILGNGLCSGRRLQCL